MKKAIALSLALLFLILMITPFDFSNGLAFAGACTDQYMSDVAGCAAHYANSAWRRYACFVGAAAIAAMCVAES